MRKTIRTKLSKDDFGRAVEFGASYETIHGKIYPKRLLEKMGVVEVWLKVTNENRGLYRNLFPIVSYGFERFFKIEFRTLEDLNLWLAGKIIL